MAKIIWLASYPKSGNTWFRTFLSNLLKEKEETVSINHLHTDGIFSSRIILDSMTGIEASNLTPEEIDRLRPAAYNHLAEGLPGNLYIKVRDAFTYLDDGSPLLGTRNAKAIYFLRNPLDVAVSFSNHSSCDLDTTINNMGDPEYVFCRNERRLANQLRQKLLTWSGHVQSWTGAGELPVHTIRFEDMKLNPLETFTAAANFMELDYDAETVRRAVDASVFAKLQEAEKKEGFHEKPYMVQAFFRRGEVGDWRLHLTERQVGQLVRAHREVMEKFGYLDRRGEIVF